MRPRVPILVAAVAVSALACKTRPTRSDVPPPNAESQAEEQTANEKLTSGYVETTKSQAGSGKITLDTVEITGAVVPAYTANLPGGAKGELQGKTIAILATDGVEEEELDVPRRSFEDAGAKTVLISPKGGEIQAMNHDQKGDLEQVDVALSDANPASYDGLYLPGGVENPDALRQDPAAVGFVKAFARTGKPIAAMCHAPWTLIEAGDVRGKTMTSCPSLKTDLTNAGARWVDQPVVDDRGLVTARTPEDLPMFIPKAIEEFSRR